MAAASPVTTDEPPVVLGLMAHPVRWRLLRELGRSDRTVRELTELLGERQSLVSYHLKELRAAGVVASRRSAADGRDTYNAVDLDRCGELLGTSATALHPGLHLVPGPTPGAALPSSSEPRGRRRRPSVLFLCTGNSSRSQIAEALTRSMSGGAVDAASAGSHPKPLHPGAVRVMADRGVDITDARPTHLDRYARRRFDVVVTLCDKVREVCPEMPGAPTTAHWSVADPAVEAGPVDADHPAFDRTAAELERRIRYLLPTIAER